MSKLLHKGVEFRTSSHQGACRKESLLGESILTITSSSPPESELESSTARLGCLLCDGPDGGRSPCLITSSSSLFLTVFDPSDFTVVRGRCSGPTGT